jgi:hypothetical protein
MTAAKDLESYHSCPCEWFVCDDVSSCTRYLVIQVRCLKSPMSLFYQSWLWFLIEKGFHSL